MEDFVTYDLAVKLKEKGFNYPCYGYYHLNGGDDSFELCGNDSFDFLNSLNTFRVAAPIISQVLKWLRDEKKLHVSIMTFMFKAGWFYEFVRLGDSSTLVTAHSNGYNTYEKAALAGIEYVIDNLI